LNIIPKPLSMTIKRQEEFSISPDDHKAIERLLALCFSDYPKDRSYYKQAPDFRFLVWEDQQLIGHMAVEHRMINVAGSLAKIFGVVDLCVDQAFQGHKIASQLLQNLEKLGKQHQIDFVLLTASDLVNNPFRWLILHEHQTLGVGSRRFKDSVMVKSLGKMEWEEGLVDLLGHVF